MPNVPHCSDDYNTHWYKRGQCFSGLSSDWELPCMPFMVANKHGLSSEGNIMRYNGAGFQELTLRPLSADVLWNAVTKAGVWSGGVVWLGTSLTPGSTTERNDVDFLMYM